MEYKDFTNFVVSDPIVINNKNGKPLWDLYTLEMNYAYGDYVKKVRLITEHNGIDLKNTSPEVQRNFFITRLFGKEGLFEKQGREDFIFLGRLDYKEDKYKPSRFYSVPYSNLDAQTYFDRNYRVLENSLKQQEINDEKRKELEERK